MMMMMMNILKFVKQVYNDLGLSGEKFNYFTMKLKLLQFPLPTHPTIDRVSPINGGYI